MPFDVMETCQWAAMLVAVLLIVLLFCGCTTTWLLHFLEQNRQDYSSQANQLHQRKHQQLTKLISEAVVYLEAARERMDGYEEDLSSEDAKLQARGVASMRDLKRAVTKAVEQNVSQMKKLAESVTATSQETESKQVSDAMESITSDFDDLIQELQDLLSEYDDRQTVTASEQQQQQQEEEGVSDDESGSTIGASASSSSSSSMSS